MTCFVPNTWSLVAHHTNFCNRNYESEMILELSSVNRHVLQFVIFVWMQKYILLAKDTGWFAAFIQTVVGKQLTLRAKIHLTACQTSNGLFQKKSTPPRRMARFSDPPAHLDFLDHCDPLSYPDFPGQRPPLLPGFPLFFKNPKFILQAIEKKTHVAFSCFRRYSFIIFNKSFTITKIVQ